MANDPWTGARLGANTDNPQNGGGYFAEVINEMGKWTIPSFASSSARDTAFTQWKANGNTAVDGMRCRTANDKQTWVLTGGSWTWPSEGQGQLCRADFSDVNSPTPLQATPAVGLPAFTVVYNGVVPAGRHIEVWFSGNYASDVAGTVFGFVLGFGGFIHRGFTPPTPAGGTGAPVTFHVRYTFDTTVGITNPTAGISAASRFAGTGSSYLISGGLDGVISLVVSDLGAV